MMVQNGCEDEDEEEEEESLNGSLRGKNSRLAALVVRWMILIQKVVTSRYCISGFVIY